MTKNALLRHSNQFLNGLRDFFESIGQRASKLKPRHEAEQLRALNDLSIGGLTRAIAHLLVCGRNLFYHTHDWLPIDARHNSLLKGLEFF
jgi:hypothetical protein